MTSEARLEKARSFCSALSLGTRAPYSQKAKQPHRKAVCGCLGHRLSCGASQKPASTRPVSEPSVIPARDIKSKAVLTLNRADELSPPNTTQTAKEMVSLLNTNFRTFHYTATEQWTGSSFLPRCSPLGLTACHLSPPPGAPSIISLMTPIFGTVKPERRMC